MNEENYLREEELYLQNDTHAAETENAQPQTKSPVETDSAEGLLQTVHEKSAADECAAEESKDPDQAGRASHNAYDKKTIPYHERYYLRYHEGKRTAALDLNATRSFLENIGFDGGELRQARNGKDNSKSYQIPNKRNRMHCSYCGDEISGVEFYRLPDGRMRCTTCSNTVVKTKAEAEELCRRVITNMDNFFGAAIHVPVSISIMDGRKLKKRIGVPLGTRDDQSVLILGVAINKKDQYSILLENGAPRISLIATFAHELTHIWQYTHWDRQKGFKKCSNAKRLLLYEGMAKWAEIQYLYLSGETNVARREESITRARQDEYGIGFRLYEERYPLSYEAMMCEETPFISDGYPLE